MFLWSSLISFLFLRFWELLLITITSNLGFSSKLLKTDGCIHHYHRLLFLALHLLQLVPQSKFPQVIYPAISWSPLDHFPKNFFSITFLTHLPTSIRRRCPIQLSLLPQITLVIYCLFLVRPYPSPSIFLYVDLYFWFHDESYLCMYSVFISLHYSPVHILTDYIFSQFTEPKDFPSPDDRLLSVKNLGLLLRSN